MNILKSELFAYRTIFENELKNNILAWWVRYSPDHHNGGFYGAADLEGKPVLTANKSCVLNARLLWTFSAAAMRYDEREYRFMADRAWQVMQENFADREAGGYFMELRPDHSVASDIKHTYAQAFVIYAMCKYYEYNRSPEVFEVIKQFFMLLEARTKVSTNPGYIEACTRDWKPCIENRMADNNEPRSMNTHLHLLEAYAALFRVWQDELVRERLRELILLFTDKIIRPDGHLGIFFDESFRETEPSRAICSFGHDIEASWLLWEAAGILGDSQVTEKMRSLSLLMADAVERTGLDRDGGLFLESSRFGSHVRTNKHWWLQAETMVGFMNAFMLTGNEKYWDNVKQSWGFIDKHVIDHERGEWFTKVSRLGVPYLVEPADDPSPYYRNDWKIDPWKCPYHNGRSMMELIDRINGLVK